MTAEVQTKIEQARLLPANSASAAGVIPYRNVGGMLFKQANAFDTKPYLIHYDLAGNRIEYAYKDFFLLVQQCANLIASYGIRRGDRLATVSQNHSDTVLIYFAAWLLGACVVPVSLGEDDERIEYVLTNSDTKLAFLRADHAERILPILQEASIPTILCGGGHEDMLAAYPDLAQFDSALEAADVYFVSQEAVTLEDEALIVYTSGTTGNPKGVVLTQRNLLADAKGISEWHELTANQRMMCVLPIHHVNGTIVTIVTPMFFGGTVVLNERFQSEHFFERIAKESVNVVSVVPTLLAFLLEHYRDHDIPTHPSLRHIICGAGPLTVELGQQFEDKFGIPIMHGYGLSETTCYSCFLPVDLSLEEHRHWMRAFGYPSIGVALPQNEMMIADESGVELPPSSKGEIAIRGINVMKYYDNNPDANEKTFSYGWFRSGDEGFYEVDASGRKYFFITGRLKELIIRGGVNISPLEIDEVLGRCPGVKVGIAVGFENDFYGEEVGAYVQRSTEAAISEAEVLAFCEEHLPHAKRPKVVIFGEDIPVTSTGKYQRNKCKPLFQKWKSAQFRKSKEG